MKQAGTWDAYHPWMDLLLPAETAEEIVASALAALDPRLLDDAHVMTYPLRRAATSTPLLPVPGDTHGSC